MMTFDEARQARDILRADLERAGLRVERIEPLPNAPGAWALRFHCLCAHNHPRLFVSDRHNGALYLISQAHAHWLIERHTSHYQQFLAEIAVTMPVISVSASGTASRSSHSSRSS